MVYGGIKGENMILLFLDIVGAILRKIGMTDVELDPVMQDNI